MDRAIGVDSLGLLQRAVVGQRAGDGGRDVLVGIAGQQGDGDAIASTLDRQVVEGGHAGTADGLIASARAVEGDGAGSRR